MFKKAIRNHAIAIGAASIALVGGIAIGGITFGASASQVNDTANGSVSTVDGANGATAAGRGNGRGSRVTIDPADVAVSEDAAQAAAVAAVGSGEATRASLRAGRGEDANAQWLVTVTSGETTYVVSVDAETGVAGEPREHVARESSSRGERVAIDPADVAVSEDAAQAAAVAAVGSGEATRASLRAGRGEDANAQWLVTVTSGETTYVVSVDAETGVAGEPREHVARESSGGRRGRGNGNGNGNGTSADSQNGNGSSL